MSRRIYWDERRELIETPVLRIEGETLFDEAVGPMLIELPDTVIVVRPDQTAHLDRDGNVVIKVV
jgi:N-methylhydantoinase A/oxoprolinase/acetone carboxylase beta subunit